MLRALGLLLMTAIDAGVTAAPARMVVSRSDAGAPDAGPSDGEPFDAGAPDGGSRARWRTWETEWFDGGFSDLVELPVGEQVELTFPRRTVAIVCDDPTLFTLDALPTSHRFTGLKPGRTHCGFWYAAQPFPHRYVDITVVP